MKLGDVLKKERENKGLAQSEVARQLQLSEEAYRQLEAGRAPGGWTEDDIVQRFAHAVGTSPELIRNKIRDL